MNILTAKEEKRYDEIIEASSAMNPRECNSKAEAHAVGKAYEKKNVFSKSIDWYIRSYELGASDEEFGMIAGVCLACGNYSKLREVLNSIIADTEGYYYRAACYELALRTGESAEKQIEALENFLDVQYEESYMLRLAMLYIENDRNKEAGKLCRKIGRLFNETEAASYAKNLADAVTEGNGAEFIRRNPWLKDQVFKHVSFDLDQPSLKDITIGASVSISNESPEKRTPDSGRKFSFFGSGSEKKKADGKSGEKKDRISPIVEKSMADIVGMEELKKSLTDIANVLQIEKRRDSAEAIIRNNIKILGPDGCGKTTAAHAACKVLAMLSLADDEIPVTTDYDSLVTDDEEELHNNIQELFNSALGKCLIIENIHEFNDSSAYSIGSKIIDSIIKAYNAADGAVIMIITGREEETNELLIKKPKFSCLFNLGNVVLGKYSTDDLMKITDKLAEEKNLIVNDTAKLLLRSKLENMASQPDFTYSKDLERIVTDAYINMSKRLAGKRRAAENDYYIITEEDINASESEETVEELIAKLNDMTGLNAVKEQVRTIVNLINARKMRAEEGIGDTGNGTLHMVFTGNAGTGKTTVARIIGKIYRQLGVLPNGNFVECTRKDLISSIVGKTAPTVSEKVKEAMGGIMFIDEAYSLCRDDSDTYGKEAIETLLTEIENHRDSFMVILAGYGPEMDKFLDKNQGLRSRMANFLNFEDYTVDEMVKIFKDIIKEKNMLLDVGLENDIRTLLDKRSRHKAFGNARGVRNVVEEIMRQQANRLADGADHSRNDFLIIKKEDITALIGEPGSGVRKTVDDYLNELYSMTGLASVKKKVESLAATAKANQEMFQMGIENQSCGTLHMVFKGNAGTGKTTVARIIGNIYRELGVLSQGQLVECNRSSLVAGYVGQTAERTRAKIEEAIGGVLFIDEAYSLMQGGETDFGREAINELVAQVENHREDLCVIIAGYSDDMDMFLSANQGLSSRFSEKITFEDYTPDEMMIILNNMLAARNHRLADGIEEAVTELIAKKAAAKDFGNARGVRNIADDLIKVKNVRILPMLGDGSMTNEEKKALLTTITADDVNMLIG